MGDVVYHTADLYRGVVVGWAVDDETGAQQLDVLVDAFDWHEKVTPTNPDPTPILTPFLPHPLTRTTVYPGFFWCGEIAAAWYA